MPSLQQLTDDFMNRDPEVLLLFSVLLKHTGDMMSDFLPTIMVCLCQPTLLMIQQDTTSNPEFREGMFRLAMNMIKHCSSGLFAQSSESFQLIINTVLFAMKHTKPDLMELGNESMFALCCTLAE
jgi:exportin-1